MSDIPTASSPKESVPSFRRASLRRTCHSSRCTAAGTNASTLVFRTQSSPLSQNKKHTTTTVAARTIDTTTDSESEAHRELLERFLSLQTTEASSSSSTGRRLPPAPPRDQINSRSSLRLSARVPTVLERLSTFLRVHSIEHTFHFSNDDDNEEEEEESVRVCCRTANLLHFVVLLWRGGNDDDDDDDDDADNNNNNSIVVEVQRRKGCSVEMQCVRRALFAVLQASDDEASTTTCSSSSQQQLSMCHKMIPPSFCKKVYEKYRPSTEQQSSSTTQTSSSSSIASDESSVECCLERCRDLLNSACRERNQLGLECLVNLTDPAIADRKTAKEGAWSTLQDDSSIQQPLLRYIIQKESADESTETHEELHTLALMVLVNSLRVFRADDDLLEQHRPQMMDVSSDFWHSILESCQNDLATVAQHPRDAELSIEVLHSVLELVPRAVAAAIVRDCRRRMLLEHLMEANSFGKLYLLSLEEKSQGLLDHLQMYL